MAERIVAVIGAGTMGQGIAQQAAACGCAVRLVDVTTEGAERGRSLITAQLDKLVAKGKLTEKERTGISERIVTSASIGGAALGADVVLEAVFENIDLKINVLREAAEAAPKNVMLATNTSSLSITEIGSRVGRPDRVVGIHFFNPVPVMDLIEVVRGVATNKVVIVRAVGLATQLKKTAIVVRDVPGFATSRLGVILGCEAIRMLEQGVAGVDEIDRAMELGYKHPMGPLKLTDLVGLDVRLAILDHLHRELGEQFRPPPLLRSMVRAGKLGKKSGEGFYTWEEGVPRAR